VKNLPSLPSHMWADFDPDAPGSKRWAFYRTKADQRSNRPDLPPIRVRVVHAKAIKRR